MDLHGAVNELNDLVINYIRKIMMDEPMRVDEMPTDIHSISVEPDSGEAKIIKYLERRIRVFGSSNDPWFHGSDFAYALGYMHTNTALSKHINDSDKLLGKELNELNPSFKLGKYEKHSIFINKSGACSILSGSKMPNKQWLIELLSNMYGISYTIITRLGKEQEFIGSITTSFACHHPIRQFKIGTYMIDLYFPTELLAIECDEFNHTKYDKNDDIVRQEFITDTLKCKFIRFNPDDAKFSIFSVISDIQQAILKHHLSHKRRL